MSSRIQHRKPKGYSLVELLVVLALISTVAAMVCLNLSSVTGSSEIVKSRQNAREICSLHAAALSVGATFVSTTREGILDELIVGKYGVGAFSNTWFQLSLTAEEKAPALAYCRFDAVAGMMYFDSAGAD